jgi:hypothetical protein
VNEELLAVIAESRREYCVVRPPGAINRKLELIMEEPPPTLTSSAAVDGQTVTTLITPTPIPTASMPQQTLNNDEMRFLYDSEDLYESIAAVRNPNLKQAYEDRIIGHIKLNIKTPTNAELCAMFHELNPGTPQLGIDDKSAAIGNKICHSRQDEADSMCVSHACPILDARRYLRKGCPVGLRNKLYRSALSLQQDAGVHTVEQLTFAQLRLDCDRLDLVTDDLYLHDVQGVIDDTRFFVFEVRELSICQCSCI